MIDLHSHTDKSDGTLSAVELIDLARVKGLRTLAITDHDTLEGYKEGASYAREHGLELICGVELSTKFHGQTIHILGYFFHQPPGRAFCERLDSLQKARKDRNRRLAARLRDLHIPIDLEEAERLGRSQTGRPHFAQLLVQKGYAGSIKEAFDRYLDESAPGYVERREVALEDVIHWIHEAGGLVSWAHPARMLTRSGMSAEAAFREIAWKAIDAIEAYHSDHGPEQQAVYQAIAAKLGLAVTGGSDFHGAAKPQIELGQVTLPAPALEALRRLRPASPQNALR